MLEHGQRLGRVSPIRRWSVRSVDRGRAKSFRIGGAVDGYPSLRSAVSDAGLFHPNCTHSVEAVVGEAPSDETPEERP